MQIQKAQPYDMNLLSQLALQLWPDHTPEAMGAEIKDILEKDDAVFFLAYEENEPVGFAQCGLRHDYVEGTESSPVGYLEGIYMKAAYRNRGIARQLLSACQDWAKAQGCREFASDCELSNEESLAFHLTLGFEETNRIICFAKKL